MLHEFLKDLTYLSHQGVDVKTLQEHEDEAGRVEEVNQYRLNAADLTKLTKLFLRK